MNRVSRIGTFSALILVSGLLIISGQVPIISAKNILPIGSMGWLARANDIELAAYYSKMDVQNLCVAYDAAFQPNFIGDEIRPRAAIRRALIVQGKTENSCDLIAHDEEKLAEFAAVPTPM